MLVRKKVSEGAARLISVDMLIVMIVGIIVFIAGHETWSPLVTSLGERGLRGGYSNNGL
jgi:hypothetical protein